MNELINSIFGDSYITLDCEGGECLHYSQVPGYVVCMSVSSLQYCFKLLFSDLPNPTIRNG